MLARRAFARDANDDVADAGAVDAIADEIAEHLTEAGGITFDQLGDAGGDDRADFGVLFRGAPGERFGDVLDERARAEVDRMERRLDVERRELEQILDDREQMFGGCVDCARVVDLIHPQSGIEQQARHAEHAVQRRAQIVAEHAQELPQRAIVDDARLPVRRSVAALGRGEAVPTSRRDSAGESPDGAAASTPRRSRRARRRMR